MPELFPRANFGGGCIPEAGSESSFPGRAWDTSVNVFILWLFRSERQDLQGHDPGVKERPISCPWLAQGGGVCKTSFYGAFVTWLKTGWADGGCRYSPGLLWSYCTQWGAGPWDKSPGLQQSQCGSLYQPMIWPLDLRWFCRKKYIFLFLLEF